jgi:hypothetical protein
VVWRYALSIGDMSSRDVQLLLWAVGEARERREADRSTVLHDAPPEFFTEWQPPADEKGVYPAAS